MISRTGGRGYLRPMLGGTLSSYRKLGAWCSISSSRCCGSGIYSHRSRRARISGKQRVQSNIPQVHNDKSEEASAARPAGGQGFMIHSFRVGDPVARTIARQDMATIVAEIGWKSETSATGCVGEAPTARRHSGFGPPQEGADYIQASTSRRSLVHEYGGSFRSHARVTQNG